MKRNKNVISRKKGWLVFSILIGVIIIATGTTLGIELNKSSSSLGSLETIGVYLDNNYYQGKILRESKRINLTKDLEEYKDQFSGYTTTDDFSRLLNAVELRNGDSLVIKLDKNRIDNWQNYIRWVDTLILKSWPNQYYTFEKRDNEQVWESNSELAYAYPKDMVDSIRNKEGSCFSKAFYDSLSRDEKDSINNPLQRTSFFRTITNDRVDSLDDLNDEEWSNADKNGNGFACFQKIKRGSVIVKKISEDKLLFTWDGYTDYSFLENDLTPKYGMNYSYIKFKNQENDNWYFATGILFSNLNNVHNTQTADLTNLSEQFRQSTSGLFTRYDKDQQRDVDSNWRKAIDAYGLYSSSQYLVKTKSNSYFRSTYDATSSLDVKIKFKSFDKSFAGLYPDNTFYDWYMA